jgi:hypothetical protein
VVSEQINIFCSGGADDDSDMIMISKEGVKVRRNLWGAKDDDDM